MKNPFKPQARLRELPHGHYIVDVRTCIFDSWEAVTTSTTGPEHFVTRITRDCKMSDCVTKDRKLAERLYEIAQIYVRL